MAKKESVSRAERRKSRRAPAQFIVLYRVDEPLRLKFRIRNKQTDAIMQNISVGGMRALTNYSLPVNAAIDATFVVVNEHSKTLTVRTRSITVKALVRYCRVVPEMCYAVGLQFVNLSVADRAFIRLFVRRLVNVLKVLRIDKPSR